MTVFLQDGFTATSLTQLVDHLPTVGGAWGATEFTTSAVAPDTETVCFSNVLMTRPSLGVRGAIHRNNVDPGSDHYLVQAHLAFGSAVANRYWALCWRMTPTGTTDDQVDRYMLVGDAQAGQWELYKIVGGSANRELLDVASGALANSEFTVRIETHPVTGQKVYVNDVLTLESADVSITQRGRVGIGCGFGDLASGHWADDLVCTAVSVEPVTVITPAWRTMHIPRDRAVVPSSAAQDPAARLDYRLDWSEWLAEDDEIVAHSVTATGMTVEDSVLDGAAVTVWLSGGTHGHVVPVTVHVETADGRVDERTLLVFVRES